MFQDLENALILVTIYIFFATMKEIVELGILMPKIWKYDIIAYYN